VTEPSWTAAGLREAIAARSRGEFARAAELLAQLRPAAEADGPVMAAQVSIVDGEVALETGRVDDAAQLFTEAVDMLAGDGSPEAVTVRAYATRKLATAWQAAGRYDDALQQLRDALATAVHDFGESSVEAADVHNDLGVLMKARGDFTAALAHYEAVQATDPQGEELAVLCHNLGGIHYALGAPQVAVGWARRGIELRSALGDGPALTLDLAALAPILIALDEYDEARAVLDDVLAKHLDRYGPIHHEVAVAQHNLGGLLARQGLWAQAYAEIQRALATKEAVFGPSHPQLVSTLRNLAVVAAELGDQEAARNASIRADSIAG
jgi:tetratricopeptide (TPR) repeat protein